VFSGLDDDATGILAAAINGQYSPTQERGADGRVVYIKADDQSMRIQHCSDTWQVQKVLSNGSFQYWAFIRSSGRALHACGSRSWRQYIVEEGSSQGSWRDQPDICMSVVAEMRHSDTPNTHIEVVEGPNGVEHFVITTRTIEASEELTVDHTNLQGLPPGGLPQLLFKCRSK
jgi:hypothetical protein